MSVEDKDSRTGMERMIEDGIFIPENQLKYLKQVADDFSFNKKSFFAGLDIIIERIGEVNPNTGNVKVRIGIKDRVSPKTRNISPDQMTTLLTGFWNTRPNPNR